jgi:hypothetical protein
VNAFAFRTYRLQRGDRSAWKSLFTKDAGLFDDGNPRSLTEFSDEAVGHERFTRIEQVENNACDVLDSSILISGAISGPISSST